MKLKRHHGSEGNTLIAYVNTFATYGKTFSGHYKIELSVWYGFNLSIYKSKRKPIFKNIFIIGALWSIILIPFLILASVVNLIWNYIDGGINYFKNGVWANNVRFFNNVNMILIIILIALVKWT